MVPTLKKNNHKKQLSQLNETLNDFVIGNNTNVSAAGNESLEPQTNGRYSSFERIIEGENSACRNQVLENNNDDKIKRAVDNAVMTVENRMHDAILTAMNNGIIPRVEMAVRLITGSSGQGPSSVVQNPDRRYFTRNTESTTLMSASNRLDLNVDQYRIGETRNVENFEDGDFPALRTNYDRRAHAHHTNPDGSALLYSVEKMLKTTI